MNGQTMTIRKYGNLFLTVIFFVFASGTTLAQVPVDEDGNTLPAYYEDDLEGIDEAKPAPAALAEGELLSAAELEELVGPVALYPDELLAIVLPASTYPLEVVQAARFLEQLETDSSLKPDEEWDDSIVALLNYPDVVQMMDADIDWTWRLGEAVISQQSDVIAAVEAFRDRAYAAGNLKTDENQTVTYDDDGAIEITPVDEEIIYVPYYEPQEVVVYQPRRVYHYYPDPYPVYYYPYPLGYNFYSGYFWGVTTAFHIGWSNHYLHVYHPSYWGHPYYGYTYYDYYYRRPSIGIYNTWYVNNSYRHSNYRYRDGDYWRPRTRAGSRQDEPRVRNHYYPPGDSDRRHDDRRDDSRYRDSNSGRNLMDNRNNGRLALNLRERNESDRIRVAANNGVRTGVANNSVNNRRATSTDRGAANATNRNNASNRNRSVRTPDNNANSGAARTDNRNRSTTTHSRTDQNRVRSTTPRAEIQFRDRSNGNRAAASGNTVRPAQRQSSNRSNRAAPITSSSFVQREAPPQRATAPRTSTPRVTAPRSSIPRATARRSSAPRVSAPARESYQARPTAPRVSAPRVSAPRASAPRVSAPSRSSAPRVSAPRAQAPRASAAPQRSAPSSSSRSSGQRSRSSSSRARSRSH